MIYGMGGCRDNKEEVYQAAWDNGIRVFDSGIGYSGTLVNDRFLGQFLEDKKDYRIINKLPLFAKVYKDDPYTESDEKLEKEIRLILNMQLAATRQDHFYCYMYHAIFDRQYTPDYSIRNDLELYKRVQPILEKLKQEGKFEHIGFSAHCSLTKLKLFIETMKKMNADIDTAMISYNPLNKDGVERWTNGVWAAPGHKGLEYLKRNNFYIINMRPTEEGRIDAKEAYELIRKEPLIDMTLVGTSNVKHLLEDIGEGK